MAQFRPFRGLLYNEPGSAPKDGVMDVSPAVCGKSKSDYSIDHLLTEPALAMSWLDSGHLIEDDQPALYMFRAGWRRGDGVRLQASGVFGVIDPPPGQLLVQPIVVNVANDEFDLLLVPTDMALVTATVTDGTHFRLWALRATGVIQTIAEAVERTDPAARGLVVATNDGLDPPPGLVLCGPQTN